MRILLTGASGFIGNYIKNHLVPNHEVIAPSSKVLDVTSRNTVSDFFKDQYFDAVIHTAINGRNSVTTVDHTILADNLYMFLNLYEHQNCYGKFINLGSGAEFGLDNSIDNAKENDLTVKTPKESYGMSKNLITQIIKQTPNFFNLRLFSCFDPSESNNRLLKKFNQAVDSGEIFEIKEDRYVDFVSLYDVAQVIDAVLSGKILDSDLNVVYDKKYKISEILYRYCMHNNISTSHIQVTGTSDKNYTGSGDRLLKYNLGLMGLDLSLSQYNKESFK